MVDLVQEESRGGHTLERHVGLDAAALRARLNAVPAIPQAGSFDDLAIAEAAVAAALAAHSEVIEAWVAAFGGSRSRPKLPIAHDSGRPVGMVLLRNSAVPIRASRVQVVLCRQGGGVPPWFVLTAYPDL